MYTWTMTAGDMTASGSAPTRADGWRDAHNAAAAAVHAGRFNSMRIVVDGHRSTIHPGRSDSTAADVAALLDIIRAGRDALVTAHQNPADEVEI